MLKVKNKKVRHGESIPHVGSLQQSDTKVKILQDGTQKSR